MKAILAATGLLFMPPCERPPVQYQGQSVPAVIIFAPPEIVDAVCRQAARTDDKRQILACTDAARSVILFPDPCLFNDNTSALLCHEIAHLRRRDGSPGWVH